jgi:inner membrane protein CreD
MWSRITAIAFIFVATSVAWLILGMSLEVRTRSADDHLRGSVASTWGTAQAQKPPVMWAGAAPPGVTTPAEGRTTACLAAVDTGTVPIEASRVNVDLALAHRRKGLLWYSTYAVRFAGRYRFRDPSGRGGPVAIRFEFPSVRALYDDLTVTLDGRPVPFQSTGSGVTLRSTLAPGVTTVLGVAYRSQGLDRWSYLLAPSQQVGAVRDFVLEMTTNFRAIDFPDNTLSPTLETRTPHGWRLSWRYRNLVSGFQIGMAMPQRLQPGPVAGRLSLFAPVSLLLFFFALLLLTTLRGIPLHPINYFFLACAFFAFHLLLAYLADLVPLGAALAICSAVSVFLVVSYLRLVAGLRFAALEAGGAQLLYLVLFSCAFLIEGWTGLVVTVGAIVTLFVAMQLTGRIRWSERLAPAPPASGAWPRG